MHRKSSIDADNSLKKSLFLIDTIVSGKFHVTLYLLKKGVRPSFYSEYLRLYLKVITQKNVAMFRLLMSYFNKDQMHAFDIDEIANRSIKDCPELFELICEEFKIHYPEKYLQKAAEFNSVEVIQYITSRCAYRQQAYSVEEKNSTRTEYSLPQYLSQAFNNAISNGFLAGAETLLLFNAKMTAPTVEEETIFSSARPITGYGEKNVYRFVSFINGNRTDPSNKEKINQQKAAIQLALGYGAELDSICINNALNLLQNCKDVAAEIRQSLKDYAELPADHELKQKIERLRHYPTDLNPKTQLDAEQLPQNLHLFKGIILRNNKIREMASIISDETGFPAVLTNLALSYLPTLSVRISQELADTKPVTLQQQEMKRKQIYDLTKDSPKYTQLKGKYLSSSTYTFLKPQEKKTEKNDDCKICKTRFAAMLKNYSEKYEHSKLSFLHKEGLSVLNKLKSLFQSVSETHDILAILRITFAILQTPSLKKFNQDILNWWNSSELLDEYWLKNLTQEYLNDPHLFRALIMDKIEDHLRTMDVSSEKLALPLPAVIEDIKIKSQIPSTFNYNREV